MNSPRFLIFSAVALCIFKIAPNTLDAAPEGISSTTATASAVDYFPAVKLRAYGILSGKRTTFSESPQSSLLRITCESKSKAQLVLAKYLSDLGLLPGVTALPLSTSRGSLAARQVEGQGVVAAERSGVQVCIFTSANGPSLQKLYEAQMPADQEIDATEPEIPVPMYVDRWDKHAFRFYYGPFVKPQDENHRDVPTYDPRQDFTFAKESGHVGLVVWNVPFTAPTADGIMNFSSRDWVFKAGKELKLPMGVNLGLEDANTSLINRFPADMVPNADQYLGGWYGAINFGGKTTAWSADATQDVALSQLIPLMRRLKDEDTVVNWLEPHEEMCHGVCDVLDDHGPNAQLNFHRFLKAKYMTPEAVATRWQQPGAFKTWKDVPFPEFATFLGFNSTAIDLSGTWKMSYEAPYNADSARPDMDDSSWKSIRAPGHSIVRVLPRKPAVFRRHIAIEAAWRAAHPRVWLYVLDLNNTRGDSPTDAVLVFVNGKAIPENPPFHTESHWGMLDVTSAVSDGDNLITVCLPQALFDYRVYLSGDAPAFYPDLGPRLNAQWADFSDWTSWSRGQAVRRGAQMIRQVDPDRPITFMSPDVYMSSIKEVAEDYGGIFHDTGGMAGSWGDMHPIMVQSMGLPSDCEPGSGAVDLDDFKRFMGRWSTEGTQGIDYFQHIGDVLWKPAVKDYFLKTLNLWHLIGKYHVPQADLAVLNSDRNLRLTGFPWNSNEVRPDLIQRNRFWPLVCNLLVHYPRGGIVEADFARGNADKFRVVLDANTTIMEPEVVADIEKWVRKGGIFITYQQTGRHTSALKDAWPISRLTGYAVTGIDKMTPNGDGLPSRRLHMVAGQKVFRRDLTEWRFGDNAAGLSLKKVDPACEDLLQWDDGSIAAGVRPLGKGLVFNLGANSMELAGQILEWVNVRRVPVESSERAIMARHFVSNNGLYDIWAMWNTEGKPITSNIKFREGFRPNSCRDVNTGELLPIVDDNGYLKLSHLAFESWQTRVFLSPRNQLAQAPSDWFTLQRSWWAGTGDPGKPIHPYQSRRTLNLTDDWAYKIIAGEITGTPKEDPSLGDPNVDDSSWKRMRIGVFNVPDNTDAHHVVFRKTFGVPKEWNHGSVCFFASADALGGWRRYIDGKPLQHKTTDDDLGGILTPGSKHALVMEMWGPSIPAGITTPVYISYKPDPVSRQQMKDNWAFAEDRLTYAPASALPLVAPAGGAARTVVKINANESIHNVFVHVDAGLDGVIFNGQWIGGFSNIYRQVDLNVTPWVKFGQDNEVIAVFHDKTTITEASLEFYNKAAYP